MRKLQLLADWVDKANVFLEDAQKHLHEAHYWLTCFEAHQAAELYLKSFIVSVTGFHPYTHDLVELADALRVLGIEVSEDVINSCEVLTPHYTLSRYPGRRVITYTKERAERCLLHAKKIISWVRDVADP